jgi:hypothetical protein
MSIEHMLTGNDNTGTFETDKICRNVSFSEADIREFLEKSRIISDDERDKLLSEGRISRCRAEGTLELENGERVTWDMDRARMGSLYFHSPHRGMEWLYCETCDSKRRYSIAPGDLEKLRPKVKTITIVGNDRYTLEGPLYTPTESCQKEFTLTPDDIREFFDLAEPVSSYDKDDPHDGEQSHCHLIGEAVLQDGTKATWIVNRFRRGYLDIPGGEEEQIVHYFCENCQSKKYYAPCDTDCINSRYKDEDLDAPDPETGD